VFPGIFLQARLKRKFLRSVAAVTPFLFSIAAVLAEMRHGENSSPRFCAIKISLCQEEKTNSFRTARVRASVCH
jgi:hypothetical protein